jgi:hypothetical protein
MLKIASREMASRHMLRSIEDKDPGDDRGPARSPPNSIPFGVAASHRRSLHPHGAGGE